MSCVFVVEGPLLGYRASVRRAFDPAYKAFKERVRLLANLAGVPSELESDAKAKIIVIIHWKRKPRIDGENVMKALVDAIWTQDRRVFDGRYVVHENTGETEWAKVEVRT